MKTVYRVFDRFDQAELASAALQSAGLTPDVITGRPDGRPDYIDIDVPGIGRVGANRQLRDHLTALPPRDRTMSSLMASLGVPASEVDRCAAALRRGCTLESVAVADDRVSDADAILGRYAGEANEVNEEVVVRVIREDFEVGNRTHDTGGVRVTSRVREIPVERTVSVREERVTVERRIIDRPVEDDEVFRDHTIDLRASSEEPFATKRAHVVEEIRIHKDRDEKVAKINDTVRHTEVNLANLPAAPRPFEVARYREHHAKLFGDRYDLATAAPAYELGEQLSSRSRESDWSKVEPEARASWERMRPGTWDQFREAIFTGWKRR
ncbi:MAG: YsnF/AvaK domain-containing protein [Deltaproteobacteria bacterium]|nr:YsnF/AvaK domain-containing protein [Deltaproteobacteria bacterium]